MGIQKNIIPEGRIIVAKIPHPARGDGKARWYVVVSPSTSNTPGGSVDCFGISTKFTENDFKIKIPDDPKDPGIENPTNLNEPCAIIPDWPVTISPQHILNDNYGYIPSLELRAFYTYLDSIGF